MRILDAAEAVFAERGFAQATMDDIAAAAELSKGTLYLYFKNKDDLFLSLSVRCISEVIDSLEAIAAGDTNGLDALRAMMHCQIRNTLNRPEMFCLMAGQLAAGHGADPAQPSYAPHSTLVRRVVSAFATVLERGRRDASLRGDIEPIQTSAQLWVGFVGTMLFYLRSDGLAHGPRDMFDPEKLLEGYIDLVCNGLRPRTGAADEASPRAPSLPADRASAAPPESAP
ncbi:TetR/AcrR family transcriptional regulator [Haliangium ochraceum]|nr:TetR/AcrR family transcriptional regulator [Haliangium ochraceum]